MIGADEASAKADAVANGRLSPTPRADVRSADAMGTIVKNTGSKSDELMSEEVHAASNSETRLTCNN
jgi:hypothetical protein